LGGKAWSKIDTAATQFPIAKARRLRALSAADLAWRGIGRGRRCSGVGWLGWFDSDLIFRIQHHKRKFARKEGDITMLPHLNSAKIQFTARVDSDLDIPIS
jgi:hypothetical protein